MTAKKRYAEITDKESRLLEILFTAERNKIRQGQSELTEEEMNTLYDVERKTSQYGRKYRHEIR